MVLKFSDQFKGMPVYSKQLKQAACKNNHVFRTLKQKQCKHIN